MDAKVTLSFDEEVIKKAKKYAEDRNMSLSRLVEYLLRKATTSSYQTFEDYPVAGWLNQVAEGPAEYRTKSRGRKSSKDDFFSSKK